MLSPDTYFMSVRSLGDAIRERRISPVDLTEGYLERGRTIGSRLNAFVTLTGELALRQAREAEAEIKAGKCRGPLHGVPYAVKDLVSVKGYPTTWGAVPYAHQSFDYNATIIEHLNKAGAVLIGKAAMIKRSASQSSILCVVCAIAFSFPEIATRISIVSIGFIRVQVVPSHRYRLANFKRARRGHR
jgi:Asp-tRNA(Asn)/Glu-tRNA(Gln) amidotransferase A subunit family amidase